MHLPKLPTIFVKGGEERQAFFTIQAKELLDAGWVEKGEEKPEPKKVEAPKPEVKAEEPKVEAKAEPKPRATAKAKVEEPKGE